MVLDPVCEKKTMQRDDFNPTFVNGRCKEIKSFLVLNKICRNLCSCQCKFNVYIVFTFEKCRSREKKVQYGNAMSFSMCLFIRSTSFFSVTTILCNLIVIKFQFIDVKRNYFFNIRVHDSRFKGNFCINVIFYQSNKLIFGSETCHEITLSDLFKHSVVNTWLRT